MDFDTKAFNIILVILILFNRLLTNDVNAKGENGKISFAFTM
jgi:hypothetical protein